MPSIHSYSINSQASEKAENDKPPSLDGDSFPCRAYGFGTERYFALIEALFDGLLEYDNMKGGIDHALPPLPAA
jgi:hypothetical protein